jgi:hypothetical protein
VQAHGQPVLVDVSGSTPTVQAIEPANPIQIAVAWRPAAASSSDAHHRAARAAADGRFHTAMNALAELARRAALAFGAGDASALDVLVAEAAAIRNAATPMPAGHVELTDAMSRAGAHPASAGSGGAAAAVVTDDGLVERLRRELEPLGAGLVVETYPTRVEVAS